MLMAWHWHGIHKTHVKCSLLGEKMKTEQKSLLLCGKFSSAFIFNEALTLTGTFYMFCFKTKTLTT